jgi:hypothetical protein
VRRARAAGIECSCLVMSQCDICAIFEFARWKRRKLVINKLSIVFRQILMYSHMDIVRWKLGAEIPVGTCDTVVQVCSCAWCLYLGTVPVPVEPISKTPQVFPYPCQTRQNSRADKNRGSGSWQKIPTSTSDPQKCRPPLSSTVVRRNGAPAAAHIGMEGGRQVVHTVLNRDILSTSGL